MTDTASEPAVVKRIVVVFDICSSTAIFDGLLLADSERYWRDLLIEVKDHLRDQADRQGFELYKFLGDGWILLFDPQNTEGSVKNVIPVLQRLDTFYRDRYRAVVKKFLGTSPAVEGLTYGLDSGKLMRMKMNGQTEYVGRPLNVASRLQGAVKDKDKAPQGKVLISKKLFVDLKKYAKGLPQKAVSRSLRNLSQESIDCWKVELFRKADSR